MIESACYGKTEGRLSFFSHGRRRTMLSLHFSISNVRASESDSGRFCFLFLSYVLLFQDVARPAMSRFFGLSGFSLAGIVIRVWLILILFLVGNGSHCVIFGQYCQRSVFGVFWHRGLAFRVLFLSVVLLYLGFFALILSAIIC